MNKNAVKNVIVVITVILTVIGSYKVGHDVKHREYNKLQQELISSKEEINTLSREVKLSREENSAWFDFCHVIYQNDSVKWFDKYMQTKEYQTLDSLFYRDWEDFYFEW